MTLPESTQEAVEGPLIHVELQVSKDTLEVLVGNQPVALFVNDLEELCHASNASLVSSFDHLVDDVFVRRSVSDTVSFEFTHEFTVINGATLVSIY